MSLNKRILHGKEDLSHYNAYDEALKNLSTGRLSREKLEPKNTEFTNTDYTNINKGSIQNNYGQPHDIYKDEFDVTSSTLTRGKVGKTYHKQHNDQIDGRIEKTADIIPIAPGNQIDDASKVPDSRVPIDVQAKIAFLKKRKVLCCGDIVYLYEDDFGCYEEQTEISLFVAIRKSLSPEMDMKLGKYKLTDVVHRIVSSPDHQTTNDKFDSHTHLINFKNCVFNIKDETTFPHSPDYLFTSYIDAEYGEKDPRIQVYHSNQNGKHSSHGYYFLKFLEDCTHGDPLKMKSLQQLTGYIISNEWRAKKFFVMIGLPHTGKSVWLSLWSSLIGPKYTTAMSLKQLGETRFMVAELFKSKLNISAEMDTNGSIKASDVIKTVTGGDLVTGEKKGKDAFHFYGKTKLVAAGNHMPLLEKLDGTSAFTDRILFLIFKNIIPEEQRDKTLMEKLINEKSFIVEWALEGLRELMKNNLVFTESVDAHAFKLRYINEINNVTEFISDMCHINLANKECKVHRKVIFPIYNQYCLDNGYKSLSRQEFFAEILNLNVKPGKIRINDSTPLEGFRGLRLLTRDERKLKLIEEQ
ncbi:hypothetical protein Back11_39600 [Paenibacillus baekrokdamisoli]|uniref:Uncharacterized protein n=1 Tax=Paenibacillus baekrokdamisoli TaxID=1712516 RepID=A0A3G9J2N4_9BACL|nr:phage/plasmid primase, P4 family [Paenibacillus baekrokdamisoli]MBB3068343.1 putative DNA primase/helicase [Paenibacillus baekrokdamisoli]BBH22615.1 hypothetical protein Back11_39600 [Paenibacillus baekrokdamisoli]